MSSWECRYDSLGNEGNKLRQCSVFNQNFTPIVLNICQINVKICTDSPVSCQLWGAFRSLAIILGEEMWKAVLSYVLPYVIISVMLGLCCRFLAVSLLNWHVMHSRLRHRNHPPDSKGFCLVFVSLALAGKTHRDHFVHCCCLLSVAVKTG